MPSKLYLRGDGDEIWIDLSADLLVDLVGQARSWKSEDGTPIAFVRLEQVPYRPDEPCRPIYVDPAAVAAVAPLDPRELEASYADLPEWLEQS